MIYLDTHVVIWLYGGLEKEFSQQAKTLINEHDLFISPIISLEAQYLYEVGRIADDSTTVVTQLAQQIGLSVCEKPFYRVVSRATALSWTRDPFDRIIVAQAEVDNDLLLSKDQSILDHYPHAVW